MEGELVPRPQEEHIVPAEVLSSEGEEEAEQPVTARDLIGMGAHMGAFVVMTENMRRECDDRAAERAAEEQRREERYAQRDAQWEATRQRVEELLALSDEEGNALIEHTFARHYAQTIAGVCSSLRALAIDAGVPATKLVEQPDLFVITAISHETGLQTHFLLDGKTMHVNASPEQA